MRRAISKFVLTYLYIAQGPVIINRVQETFTLDNFLLFLSSRKIYTNKPTYFEYLSLWITKASTSLTHHKQDYLKRVFRLFDQYFQEFPLLSPSQLPSFHLSILLLFSKKDVYVGWPYMETKWQTTKNTYNKNKIQIWTYYYTVSHVFLLKI
jgi:hypothetical protein